MNYQEAATKERECLKQSNLLFLLANNYYSKGYEFVSEYITPIYGSDVYDVKIVLQKDKKFLTLFIEVKVRNAEYDDYFLEVKKYNNLEKLVEQEGSQCKLFYVNYTPNFQYIWDITTIKGYKEVKREMNKATSTSKFNKISKNVYLLTKDKANIRDFKFIDTPISNDNKVSPDQKGIPF